MNSLISCLKTIEDIAIECDSEPTARNPIQPMFHKADAKRGHELLEKANQLASALLIDNRGQPNEINMKNLKKYAHYDTICLESDGFGWVLGGIITSKGIVVYG